MVFKKALATAAVTAASAALLISNAGANEKVATVAQGDLVGQCAVSFNDPNTNRSYVADFCAESDIPTRLYGENNAPIDGLGTFHVSGFNEAGTQLAFIQWNDEVEVLPNDISTNGFAAAPQIGDTVYFHQPAYDGLAALDGQGTYAGQINGTHFVDFGANTGTQEANSGLLNGTTVWTDEGILGIIDGRHKVGDHPHLSLVASPDATGGAMGAETKDDRFALFDAFFASNPSGNDDADDEDGKESPVNPAPNEPGKPNKPGDQTGEPGKTQPQIPALDGSSGSSLGILQDLIDQVASK
ncbi:histone deacetylase [Corynebacterium stationis]|uniref:histone deacetylase n=1 Tax=Corynebacterium stationis TaxID=1705 RepID=UPI00273CAD45|nr:histone deacetylase [Corynebacterium stationis]WLP87091.1 histone deacetylase [Corynebacterium stationis]